MSSTNAKDSQLWNFYQYILTLELILNSEEWDVFYIEEFWDISKLNSGNKIETIEVKHHKDYDNLWEKHIDFWKTLYNWCNDYDRYIKFDKLIFHTTGVLPKKSKLDNWNGLSKEDKEKIITEIINSWSNPTIEKYFDFISSFDKNKLINILDKIIFSLNNENINSKIKSFKSKNPYFKWLKNPDNKEDLFNYLIWVLWWTYIKQKEINASDFLSQVRPQYKKYQEYEYVIPKIEISSNVSLKSHINENFLKELNDIHIDEDNINIALKEYLYSKKIFLDNAKNAWLLLELEKNITPNIIQKCKSFKGKFSHTKDSRWLYYDIITSWNILIKSDYFEDNKSFENWNIHINVNNKNFSWLYK